MSYADYRTGGGRRPVPPPRDRGAFDSFAATGSGTMPPPRREPPAPARHTPPSSVPNVQPPMSNASMFTSTRVNNPYATSAYASSRGGNGAVGGSPLGGDMGAGGGPEFYVSTRAKGNRQGKIKDTIKNTMAAAKQDNWKVVCVKATNHDIAAPKGKHVRVIMQGLQWGGSVTNRESPAGGIFYHLRKRMMQNEWIVAVKAQTVFHHIFRDGDEKFVEYIATSQRAREVFKMEFFGDASSEGFAHAGFVKSYGNYIEQWLAMKAAIQFPVGKSREGDPVSTARYRESPIEELLAALPVMMDTLTALFAIELAGQIKFSAVANPAFSMILRDLTLIWVALSEGMIRLLDLFFNLEIPLATIALDVYKRFVDLVAKAQPFFDIARSLNVRWQSPELGAISLELMESMQQYLEVGPQDPNENNNPTFSDEEVYEPEPEPAPEPEVYYEPDLEYYSEEEPDIEPPRPRTPSSSSSSEYESESESSSSEEEEEPEPEPTPPPPPPPPPKQFDPLADLLGITNGVGPGHMANGKSLAINQIALYTGGTPGLMQRAALEHTVDDRVANVKGMMAASPAMRNGQQPQQRSGFGVDGTNMQLALYGQQPQSQQQMYAAAMQQQQQQMAAYQTMAAYQSMAMYQSMAGMNPNAMQQQQQQFAAAAMAAQQQRGLMPGAGYMPMPQGNTAVPAMRAEAPMQPAGSYRVQRTTEKKRVSDSDAAFGPLFDQMKKSSIGK